MMQLVILVVSLGVCCLNVAFAVRRATSCHLPIPLLELPIVGDGGDEPYYDLVSDRHISATSHLPPHPPCEARRSGNGWCADRVDVCEAESTNQYLQVDFGAELIVGAISIGSVNESLYVTRYFVEYGSNTQQFRRVDADSVFNGFTICTQATNIRNFTHPVIARYIRIIPLTWVGVSPCLKLELYGCLAKECRQIRPVSDDISLLPAGNITYSSSLSSMDILPRISLCSDERSPYVALDFTQSVYLLYATVRHREVEGSNFSIMYANSSGHCVPYITVDGVSSFGLELRNGSETTILLWTPINSSKLRLNVDYTPTPINATCIKIELYGCTYNNETIDHVIDDEVMPTGTTTPVTSSVSCVIRQTVQQTPVVTTFTTLQASVTTVTNTVTSTVTNTASITTYSTTCTRQVSATTVISTVTLISATTRILSVTVTATPQSSCSCSGQQQTSASSSSSDSDVVTIAIPVVVVMGVVIVIVVVIVGIFIWRKTRSRSSSDPLTYGKVTSKTATVVENDLYGLSMESTLGNKSLESNNETSGNGVEDSRKDSLKYDYPTTVIQPKQPIASYETVSLHKEDTPEAVTSMDKPSAPVYSEVSNAHSDVQLEQNPTASPVYSEVRNPSSDPQMQHNPAYHAHSEATD